MSRRVAVKVTVLVPDWASAYEAFDWLRQQGELSKYSAEEVVTFRFTKENP